MSRTRVNFLVIISILCCLAAIYQLALMGYTFFHRFSYPFDLEWMEGGLLVHGKRLAEGSSIYPEPSIEFIPYLYTPLYPTLLAIFNYAVDISYQVGRAISIISLVVLFWQMYKDITYRVAPEEKPIARMGWLMGLGVIAASYPYMEGWFDIVRADTCLLYTSPSPRDATLSRMPSSA